MSQTEAEQAAQIEDLQLMLGQLYQQRAYQDRAVAQLVARNSELGKRLEGAMAEIRSLKEDVDTFSRQEVEEGDGDER